MTTTNAAPMPPMTDDERAKAATPSRIHALSDYRKRTGRDLGEVKVFFDAEVPWQPGKVALSPAPIKRAVLCFTYHEASEELRNPIGDVIARVEPASGPRVAAALNLVACIDTSDLVGAVEAGLCPWHSEHAKTCAVRGGAPVYNERLYCMNCGLCPLKDALSCTRCGGRNFERVAK